MPGKWSIPVRNFTTGCFPKKEGRGLIQMKSYLLIIISVLTGSGLLKADASGKHLFILSGQSNMARFKPELWFTPGINDALGEDNVIMSFYAQGGQPISKWYRKGKKRYRFAGRLSCKNVDSSSLQAS